jgi:hypothetical protein
VHSARQKQQATVARDNVQFASKAETVLELKESMRCIGEPESRDATIGTRLGKVIHFPQYVTQFIWVEGYGRARTNIPGIGLLAFILQKSL